MSATTRPESPPLPETRESGMGLLDRLRRLSDGRESRDERIPRPTPVVEVSRDDYYDPEASDDFEPVIIRPGPAAR